MVPNYLSTLNAHPRDSDISFQEEGHIYTIMGEVGTYTSTTTFVHKHFSDFDPDSIIDVMFKSAKMNDPTYKYFGMTKEDIKTMWRKNGEEASGKGTQMHYDIECFSNGQTVDNPSIEYQYFLQFRKDYPHLIPYRTEWMVYYEEYKLCGSIDMVYKNTLTNTYEIYDWKRSREIEYDSNYGKTAKTKCISHFPDSNYWHYTLQLNTYKKILEEKYDKPISAMYLLCLHPNYDTYERVEVNPFGKEMNALFALRKKEL
jgi:ATP-dependent exoDNAse (exonuclease V) beta subunit